MKIKLNKNKIIVFASIIIVCVNTISFSKYKSDLECNGTMKIAKPIINVVKTNKVETEIFENSPKIEYNFLINNYNENEINEVELEYTIEIVSSVQNFPIKYELVDVKRNKKLDLVEGKSEKIKLKTNEKEDRYFKIFVEWNEIAGELTDKVDINLKINAEQVDLSTN